MDAKITLSFDEEIILRAKRFASENNLSLSRLTEFLLRKAVSSQYRMIDDLPVSDWVNRISEGEVKYVRRTRSKKALKKEFYGSRKKK
jgi:hypothetical protein